MLSPSSNLHSKKRNRSPPLPAGRGGGGAQLCPAQAQGRARGAGARDPQETRIWRALASTNGSKDPAPPAPGSSPPPPRAHCCSADSAITLSSTCPAGGPVSSEAGLSAARAVARTHLGFVQPEVWQLPLRERAPPRMPRARDLRRPPRCGHRRLWALLRLARVLELRPGVSN